MIFDTHAHYDDARFDEDRDEVIASLKENDVRRFVDVASDLPSIEKVERIIEKYPQSYGALGIHTSELEGVSEKDLKEIEEKIRNNKRIVAVGEIGLDYYWEENPPHEVQKEFFRYQLEMARRLNKPVIIHSREAAQDTFEIMKEMHAEEIGGVVHCYSYSKEMAREYIKMGFYIGIGGVVTFKNSKKLKEIAAEIPLERIVLETDCPYLAPSPHRGERNYSGFLPLVAAEIAELRGITAEEVCNTTYQNALRLYNIKDV